MASPVMIDVYLHPYLKQTIKGRIDETDRLRKEAKKLKKTILSLGNDSFRAALTQRSTTVDYRLPPKSITEFNDSIVPGLKNLCDQAKELEARVQNVRASVDRAIRESGHGKRYSELWKKLEAERGCLGSDLDELDKVVTWIRPFAH